MKKIILLLSLFSSLSLLSTELKVNTIISINTHEKNSKKVVFAKHTKNHNIYFGIEAKNETSKDVTKCKWITSFSNQEMLNFIQALKNIEEGIKTDNLAFKISKKKDMYYPKSDGRTKTLKNKSQTA